MFNNFGVYGASRVKKTIPATMAVAIGFGLAMIILGQPMPVQAAISGMSSSSLVDLGSHAEASQALGQSRGSNQLAMVETKNRAVETVNHTRTLAAQGDAEAQYTLGALYNRGVAGVEKDMIEAVHWYRRAAEQGHSIAQYNMGVFYATGAGVARDFSAAVQWWRMAAVQGHAEAQFNIGLLYAEGTGIKQDAAEAVKWWNMAAKQGHAAARFNLGLMYMKGDGVDENQDEAVRLWRLSAKQGFTQAASVLKALRLSE